MKIALIQTNFSPPHPHLDPIPGLVGSHIYRVYCGGGHLRISGSSRGVDADKALQRALDVARDAGFTHYRAKDTDGDLVAL